MPKDIMNHNISTEADESKPRRQSLSIAYALKRRNQKMFDGGIVEGDDGLPLDDEQDLEESMDSMDDQPPRLDMLNRIMKHRAKKMAEGGMVVSDDAVEDDALPDSEDSDGMLALDEEQHEPDHRKGMIKNIMRNLHSKHFGR